MNTKQQDTFYQNENKKIDVKLLEWLPMAGRGLGVGHADKRESINA